MPSFVATAVTLVIVSMVTFPVEDLLSAAWLLLAVLCRNHQSTRQFCDVLVGCRDLRYTSIAFIELS